MALLALRMVGDGKLVRVYQVFKTGLAPHQEPC